MLSQKNKQKKQHQQKTDHALLRVFQSQLWNKERGVFFVVVFCLGSCWLNTLPWINYGKGGLVRNTYLPVRNVLPLYLHLLLHCASEKQFKCNYLRTSDHWQLPELTHTYENKTQCLFSTDVLIKRGFSFVAKKKIKLKTRQTSITIFLNFRHYLLTFHCGGGDFSSLWTSLPHKHICLSQPLHHINTYASLTDPTQHSHKTHFLSLLQIYNFG